MKNIKKFQGFNTHLRIFILISIALWLLVAFIHMKVIALGEHVYLGDIMLPRSVNILAIFGVFWMVVMGLYYYKALGPSQNNK